MKLVIERWVNDTEAIDDVILRPCVHQGQAQVEDETLLNLIWDKRFVSLMRVARTVAVTYNLRRICPAT